MFLKNLLGQGALLLTALIWGLAFTAQKSGTEHLSAMVFTSIRFFLGGLFLIPVIGIADRLHGRPVSLFGEARTPEARRHLVRGGTVCGIALALATFLQQYGLETASAGKAGFLTALYIVAVPLAGLFFGRKTTWLLWVSVGLALGGSYLLCSPGNDGFTLTKGDMLLIGCSLLFTWQIMAIDRYAPGTDCIRMSCIQFFVSGVTALTGALILGDPWHWEGIRRAAVPLLYCGFFSSGIAYTLQMVGQKYIHPALASLIMSLESVFAALFGWLILGETLTAHELQGCAVIFGAVILVQLPPRRKKA